MLLSIALEVWCNSDLIYACLKKFKMQNVLHAFFRECLRVKKLSNDCIVVHILTYIDFVVFGSTEIFNCY